MSLGPVIFSCASSAFTSSAICWQKPQTGFQKQQHRFLPAEPGEIDGLAGQIGKPEVGHGSPGLAPVGATAPFPFGADAGAADWATSC